MTLARGVARLVLAAVAWAAFVQPAQGLEVVDDAGRRVVLARPAARIVSLAPHVTELLYAAGAGARVVGAVAFSDHPPEAQRLPRVGDTHALDLERIVALDPDLVVAWRSGSPAAQLDVLAALGIPVYWSEPRTLDAIGDAIERLGTLAGTTAAAQAAAGAYRERLAALRARHRDRAPVGVFHQILDQPLMTVNGRHMISQVVALCGGRNVFADLGPLAAQVAVEAVLEADPEVIGTAGEGGPRDAGLGAWLAWPRLTAVARGNLYVVEHELISRSVPRILDGVERICAALDAARARRR
jgi:iron complex transport system substrate-binding protein